MFIESKLEKKFIDDIANQLLTTDICWRYQPVSVSLDQRHYMIAKSNIKVKDKEYFTHTVFKKTEKENYISNYFNICNTALTKILQDNNLLYHYKIKRIKLNTNTNQLNNIIASPHCDSESKDSISVLLYLNETDGDTIFFNENSKIQYSNIITISKLVTPAIGKYIIFNSNQYHSNFYPTKGRRVIMNAVLSRIFEK